jgi:hypothetical protein
MDKEFHYFINYIVAYAAGFAPEDSHTIAFSAQFVDDNTKQYRVYDQYGQLYINEISQTTDLSMSQEKLAKIMITFHFIPGDMQQYSNRKDGMFHHLNTTPNNFRAKCVLRKALEAGSPFLIGIASHAFCDTWAHQNFTGTIDQFNSISGFPQRLIPNLGHADAFTWPDKVNLIWYDGRLKEPYIDNKQRFLNCVLALFSEYSRYVMPRFSVEYLVANLRKIIGKTSRRKISLIDLNYRARLKKYAAFYEKVSGEKMLDYHMSDWLRCAVTNDVIKYKWRYKDYTKTKWYMFQESVKEFYSYIPSKFKQELIDNRLEKK